MHLRAKNSTQIKGSIRLYFGLHFTLRNTNSSLLNNVKISTDKLRTISADLTLDVADRFRGVNLVQFTASQGVNIFSSTKNSSPNKSRAMGNPDFTKLNLEITRIQGLIGNFSLHGVIESQYALNSLLSSERFTYGDSPLFRAYKNAPVSGDSGIKEKIILRYGKPIAKTFLKAYQIYGFYGYGTAWNRWVAGDEFKRTSASELGFGVNLSLLEDIRFNMEYSYPLRKKIGINKNRPVLFFYVIKKIAQRETK
jgi:hemolysin activation/secretion protein